MLTHFLMFLLSLPLWANTPTLSLEESATQIRQAEVALIQSYQKIRDSNLQAEKLVEILAIQTLGMEESEITTALKNPKADDGTVPSFIQTLDQANELYSNFQTAYDNYNDTKLDFLLLRYELFAEKALQNEIASGASNSRIEKLQGKLEILKSERSKYLASKGHLGTQEDRPRGHASQKFLELFDQFNRTLARPHRTWSETAGQLKFQTQSKLNLTLGYLATLRSVPEATLALIRGKGFIPALKSGTSSLLKVAGVKMEITDRANIPENIDPSLPINILALNHANIPFDISALAQLNVKKPAVVYALTLGKTIDPYFQRLDDAVHVIVSGLDPIKEISSRAKEGRARSFFIFPESHMPAGGYDTRIPQRNFSVLLKALRRQDLKINFVPIAQPDNQQLNSLLWMSDSPVDSKKLSVNVKKPIPPNVLDILLNTKHKSLFNLTVRQYWIDDFAEHDYPTTRIFGMLPFDNWITASDQALKRSGGCEKVFSGLSGSPFSSNVTN